MKMGQETFHAPDIFLHWTEDTQAGNHSNQTEILAWQVLGSAAIVIVIKSF